MAEVRSWSGTEQLLGLLLREPGRGELPLDVLTVEEMAEEELVLSDRMLGEDQGEGPTHLQGDLDPAR